MMAVGIIAGSTEQHVRGPGTAGFANVGVVARATVAPQIFSGARTIDAELLSLPPNVVQTQIANVPARIGRSRQRRTALDRSIGLDAQSVFPGIAACPVN